MTAQFWDDSYKEDAEHTLVPDKIVAAEIADLAPGRALDLGCGSGQNALMLAEQGWSVLGVDFSEHAVTLANAVAEQRGLDARFLVADTTAWRPDEQFELVLSTFALPGGDGNARVMSTAAAALKPGGTLLVAEWDASMAEVWHFDADELLTPEQIVAILPELDIVQAEVRHIPDMFDADDPRAYAGTSANVALVRAQKLR
jgi:2-polyprenyl-3-methyl-5-hydroxy-6-metoxy-1,4-benzoquinol methylase